MSWKCDICDTYNDDRDRICYVCGERRSEASVRAAKRKEAAEKLARRAKAICDGTYRVGNTLYLAGAAVSAAAIAAILIDTILDGNVGTLISQVLDTLRMICSTSLLTDLWDNAAAILARFGSSIAETVTLCADDLLPHAKNTLHTSYTHRWIPLLRQVWHRFADIASMAEDALLRARDTLRLAFDGTGLLSYFS